MLKLLRTMTKKELLLALLCVLFIFLQVFLELKIPDYMSEITLLVTTEGNSVNQVLSAGGKMLLCALGSLLAAVTVAVAVARIASNFGAGLRLRLFDRVLSFSNEEMSHFSNASLITRSTNDVTQVQMALVMGFQAIAKAPITAGWAIYKIYGINSHWTLTTAIAVGLLLLIVALMTVIVLPKFKKMQRLTDDVNRVTRENLTGIRVVRAFGREKFEKDRFEHQNQIYTNEWMKLCTTLSLFWGTGDLVSGLQIMLIVVLGSYFCVKGDMTAGEFIAFVSYNTMLIWPVRSLGRTISEMSKASVSVERIRYIMNSEAEQDKPDAVTPDLHGDIEFKHVTFGYGDIPVLSDVSFTIPKGTTFGILGGTGSGKSTLMHLMNRLYDLPEENGQITIGGVDIADMKGEWVRENIGMVLQEPFLFSRTIAENIGITKENMSLTEIREAAAIACVDHSVMEFTHGYDTVVGERGVTLSGGQKQRTAIARMLVQKTPIMVFDDSLSAVDAQTDALIRQALKEKLAEATVILIAHRVTTLMQADCIMVLDKGRIAEIGSHEELMEKNGIYRKIYDMQMTVEEEEAEADE